ncbi:CotS family spore coat protein [Anaeromicrobium sediminis]|uniref:CotS family spore coat protein n=1 Tax=Anaeromicrobium sediminis TaxID=1478221 RepID=UPI001596079B|nr:CotS family spore coat protein [Anaeromicrobium sediminis]
MKQKGNVKDLTQLAHEVLLRYDIVPDRLKIIQNNGLKTLWKFTYNNETKCLKRLKHSKEKSLFRVNSQIHVYNKGGKVAKVYLNIGHEPITEYNGQLFVLYEWIEGRDLNFSKPSDLCIALEGLGSFHVYSKGYKAAENVEISSKLGRWPDQYESMKKRMLKWKEEAKQNSNKGPYNTYLKHIDSIIEIADLALNNLEQSSYDKLTNTELQESCLCHQDYGEGNVILSGKDLYVIDLDGVTYDLPIRDLRKIIGKRMEKRGEWNKETIEKILKCYEKSNKLTPEEKELLKIDLLFPHWFFATVKNLFKKNKSVSSGKISAIAKLEKSKLNVLKKMF